MHMEDIQAGSLIPRQALFGNPDRQKLAISPDGSQLSWLAPLDGVMNLWIAPIDNPAAAKALSQERERGIRNYSWAYTNRHVLYLRDMGGDENWHLICINLSTGEHTDLTPFEGVQARIQQLSPAYPEEVLVGLNRRDTELHDVYRISICSRQMELMLENPGFVELGTDDSFTVRLAQKVAEDGSLDYYKPTAGGSWQQLFSIPMEDSMVSEIKGFSADGSAVYLIDSRGQDLAALISCSLANGQVTVLAKAEKADIDGLLIHPVSKVIEAASSTYQRRSWQALQPSIMEDITSLQAVEDGDLEVHSRSLDDRYWVVSYKLDRKPLHWYLYDRQQATVKFLFSDRLALDNTRLAAMHNAVVKSRDGLDLVTYYSLPEESYRPGTSCPVPNQPLPTLIVVHGGPWGRDTWGFSALHQWLANRGYAVISVNYRGSTGFGKTFMNAGNCQWGRKMQDDLADAMDWAVAKGIADPARVAIFGASYGGYAVLSALAFTPERYACGIDLVGPSNLQTLLETVPPYWKPFLNLLVSRMGNYRTEEGQADLAARSPLHKAGQISRPLLIGQGANDPRVHQSESDRIVKSLQANNTPVTYILYPDEGHGLGRQENTLSFYAVAEAFLSAHLGGAMEPFGRNFDGASLMVLEGANLIPGLEPALAEMR